MHERVILFINGEVTDYAFLAGLLQEDDFLVAVDGGLRHLLAIKKKPHLLIGDLDSVTPEQLQALSSGGVEIQRFPVEKDETDLELALLETTRRGYKTIILVGALGGRIDQMLANLYLLMLPQLHGLKVRIIDGYQEIFLIRHNAQVDGQVGDIISLLPFKGNAEGVSTTGLEYPLSNETLLLEHSRGISNRMVEPYALITLTKGCLLCVHSWTDRKAIL